jgi:hypothetical protein
MALELCNGDVSQWVLHRCDNKMCVRPSHLYSGSHQENMDDVSRSRNHPKRRLTQAEAEEIRASDEAQRTLAKRYGVSQKAVWMVKHGITYRL